MVKPSISMNRRSDSSHTKGSSDSKITLMTMQQQNNKNDDTKRKKPNFTNSSIGTKKEEMKRQMEHEIETLQQRVIDEAPVRGSGSMNTKSKTITSDKIASTISFTSLPISSRTVRGLIEHSFTTMTAIQAACIPHALVGRDIVGAARTGSGKTLAFVIPMLELLYRSNYYHSDGGGGGVGAIVLCPTRELAIQIFNVLKQVGKYHKYTIGLLIGGKKDFYTEQQHIVSTNIIIATPGRLLQHCEQTAYFDLMGLQILILDEADRILDMGFSNQIVRIIEYLPKNSNNGYRRQTMLFSATQTRDVKSLIKLSLQDPEYIGVHDHETTETPNNLQQSYVVVPVEHKLNAVYSFLKSHLKCKCIIFLSTCAQVRFVNDLFCSLRPGTTIMALHGKLSQEKRTQIYFDYINRTSPNNKNNSNTPINGTVLFATDIAARGLDFPNVDWVIQCDAPEDKAMYIHRVGRTARYRAGGKSLLIVTPGEEKNGIIDLIQGNTNSGTASMINNTNDTTAAKNLPKKSSTSVPLKKLSINPSKATIVTDRAASLVASNVQLNTIAKKAYQSYLRSITLMPHNDVFQISDLDLDAFSNSYGLASTPNLQFLKAAARDRTEFREQKNVNKKLQRLKEQIKAEKLQRKLAKMGADSTAMATTLSDKLRKAKKANVDGSDDEDSDTDQLLVSKVKTTADDTDDELPDAKINEVTKSNKRIKLDGSTTRTMNQHIIFDENGDCMIDNDNNKNIDTIPIWTTPVLSATLTSNQGSDIAATTSINVATNQYIDSMRARLSTTKEQDQIDQKDRIRQKHKKRRLELKGDRDEIVSATAILKSDENSDIDDDDNGSVESDSSASNGSSSIYTENDDSDSADYKNKHIMDVKEQEEMALALIRD